MRIGLWIHRLGPPRPISPTFTQSIPTTIAATPGRIRLVFYTPRNYGRSGKLYGCLVNFHGGGFTIGSATDDARWATTVVQQTDSIVCSVDYRLAPEHPFPTAVEDGADAVLYIWDHAEDLGIDRNKIGVSGFSAGGNMCFTVPLRLQDILLRRRGAEPPEVSSDAPRVLEQEHKVVKGIFAFYPSLDFTKSREERRLSNPHARRLPKWYPKLFDKAYLFPRLELKLDSPYLSPGVASNELLRFLPEDGISIYTCEYDSLLVEAKVFTKRLRGLGKTVRYKMVEGAMHGWDKMPNAVRGEHASATELYREACEEIRRLFQDDTRG